MAGSPWKAELCQWGQGCIRRQCWGEPGACTTWCRGGQARWEEWAAADHLRRVMLLGPKLGPSGGWGL